MQRFPIGAITDEFSPDISVGAEAMQGLGMKGAELRVWAAKISWTLAMPRWPGRLKLSMTMRSAGDLDRFAPAEVHAADAPEVDTRFQQDIFASKHTFEDQPRLAQQAFEIAKSTGAKDRSRVFLLARGRTRGECSNAWWMPYRNWPIRRPSTV